MDERLNRWEVLFQRVLILIDSAREIGIPVDGWCLCHGPEDAARRAASECP
jgi:hypothetical protein